LPGDRRMNVSSQLNDLVGSFKISSNFFPIKKYSLCRFQAGHSNLRRKKRCLVIKSWCMAVGVFSSKRLYRGLKTEKLQIKTTFNRSRSVLTTS
jgi:hypothetical protein